MHAILFQLALIPLTVSKGFLAWISVNTSGATWFSQGGAGFDLPPHVEDPPPLYPSHGRPIATADVGAPFALARRFIQVCRCST